MDSKTPKLIPCSFLVPLAYNDGRPVEEQRREQFLEDIFIEFGAYYVDGTKPGAYRRADTGEKQAEVFLKVCVSVNGPEEVKRLRELVARIGGELDQESMYFEVSDGTTAELVPSQKKGDR